MLRVSNGTDRSRLAEGLLASCLQDLLVLALSSGKLGVLFDDFVAKPLNLGRLLPTSKFALVQLYVGLCKFALGISLLGSFTLKLSLQLIDLRLQLLLSLIQPFQLLPQLLPLRRRHIQPLNRLKH